MLIFLFNQNEKFLLCAFFWIQSFSMYSFFVWQKSFLIRSRETISISINRSRTLIVLWYRKVVFLLVFKRIQINHGGNLPFWVSKNKVLILETFKAYSGKTSHWKLDENINFTWSAWELLKVTTPQFYGFAHAVARVIGNDTVNFPEIKAFPLLELFKSSHLLPSKWGKKFLIKIHKWLNICLPQIARQKSQECEKLKKGTVSDVVRPIFYNFPLRCRMQHNIYMNTTSISWKKPQTLHAGIIYWILFRLINKYHTGL